MTNNLSPRSSLDTTGAEVERGGLTGAKGWSAPSIRFASARRRGSLAGEWREYLVGWLFVAGVCAIVLAPWAFAYWLFRALTD